MGKLVKILGSGIGLASEALASRKSSSHNNTSNTSESSQAAPATNKDNYNYSHDDRTETDAPPEYDSLPSALPLPADEKHPLQTETEDLDEQDWALDEASHPSTSSETPAHSPQEVNNLISSFLHSHPPPPPPAPRSPLPLPVILPQRRPRDKKRGFVRAYAPILSNCLIDQATFLTFLKIFHASTQESKSLHVVNVAAQGAGMVPSPIAMGVSIGMQVAVGISMEVQRRSKTNTFLDRANEEFFKPRGVYALIMTYKPDDTAPARRVDISGRILGLLPPGQQRGEMGVDDHVAASLQRENQQASSTGMSQQFSNLRLSAGKTFGELELPESAPLIYPELDQAEGDKKGWLKNSSAFVSDYMDRRAQATFAHENQGSGLAGQEVGFKSSLGDPNHKAYQGGVVGLLTGGRFDPRERHRERRAGRRGGSDGGEGSASGSGGGSGSQRGRVKKEGVLRRTMKKNVLYLLIVNLPNEEQMREGREIVQRQGDGGEGVEKEG